MILNRADETVYVQVNHFQVDKKDGKKKRTGSKIITVHDASLGQVYDLIYGAIEQASREKN